MLQRVIWAGDAIRAAIVRMVVDRGDLDLARPHGLLDFERLFFEGSGNHGTHPLPGDNHLFAKLQLPHHSAGPRRQKQADPTSTRATT
jgi:hypothetical protein